MSKQRVLATADGERHPANVRQRIPLISPFTLGSEDGYRDALQGAPCAPDAVFARRYRALPVSDFADYEAGYRASYAQVKETVTL